MHALLTDAQVAQRLLDHIAAGTTDRSAEGWREPVASYRSADRLQQELQVLRSTATAFCPSAAIAAPGQFMARTAAGVPLLAVRDDDGVARVFRNACRHRGLPVAEGAGCARGFACRYHGWTYRLDGALRHVPHEDGFPGLDKAAHGLVEVSAFERHGLLFVNQDATAPPDEALVAIDGRIDAGYRQFNQYERVVEANWKVMLETFLEGYHIKPAHRETFFPFGYDNTTLVEHFGRHSRVTFPFRRLESQAQVEPAARKVEGNVTFVYHLFPNALLVVLSHHLNLVVLEPIDLGNTRMHFHSLAQREVSDERARKDAAFVDMTGTAEDRDMACAIQRGLDSGANQVFTFGQFEGAIAHFHRHLHATLDTVDREQPDDRPAA